MSTLGRRYNTLANQSTGYEIVVCFVTFPQDGSTALHLSSQEGHVAVVQLLIEANVNVNQQQLVIFQCS